MLSGISSSRAEIISNSRAAGCPAVFLDILYVTPVLAVQQNSASSLTLKSSFWRIFLIILGVGGGFCLILFGILSIRDVYKKQYELDFDISENDLKDFKGNSFIGGIFIQSQIPIGSSGGP